jgi:hypothetical protein
MNKQKLKSLTYKYFWQQKFKEVGLFFGIPTLSIGVLYLFSYFGRWVNLIFIKCGGDLVIKNNITFFEHIINGFVGVVFACGILIILYCIYELAKGWIKSNWNKANKRAMEELKK